MVATHTNTPDFFFFYLGPILTKFNKKKSLLKICCRFISYWQRQKLRQCHEKQHLIFSPHRQYISFINRWTIFLGGWGEGRAINKFYWSENMGKVQIFLIPGVYHTLSGSVLAKNSGPKTGSLNQSSVKWGPAKLARLHYREYLQMCMMP